MNTQITRIFTALAGLLLAVPALAETVYDNTNPAIVYTGAWNHESSQYNTVYDNATQDTLSETQSAGAIARLTFTANHSISLVYTMGSNRWKSQVYIDGQLRETLENRTPHVNQRWHVMKTWAVSPGTHTIEVVALGAVDGQNIHQSWSDVDAFIVDANAAVGDPNSTWTYPADYWLWVYGGTWSWVTDATHGERMQSQTRGSSVRFTFSGTNVELRYLASPNRGIAEITLDGELLGDLDQYGAGEVKAFKLSNLPLGRHTLTMTVSGRKNLQATNDIVGVTLLRMKY
ncbi:hypothetical protein [Hyalangium sp.]|uniref:hypothetical protein n=1 Tax=Hyalangium sp. TaxID=2028555 RepID=UPI002D592632|nr:hypothetical protein [Hyalangium sp.]HYH98604.1 hypothetical protein [Hyalangium sp.]